MGKKIRNDAAVNGAKRPLRRHPLFPAITALWTAALFALAGPPLLQAVAQARILDAVVQAAPMLGTTTYMVAALVLTIVGAILGLSIGIGIARSGPSVALIEDHSQSATETIEVDASESDVSSDVADIAARFDAAEFIAEPFSFLTSTESREPEPGGILSIPAAADITSTELPAQPDLTKPGEFTPTDEVTHPEGQADAGFSPVAWAGEPAKPVPTITSALFEAYARDIAAPRDADTEDALYEPEPEPENAFLDQAAPAPMAPAAEVETPAPAPLPRLYTASDSEPEAYTPDANVESILDADDATGENAWSFTADTDDENLSDEAGLPSLDSNAINDETLEAGPVLQRGAPSLVTGHAALADYSDEEDEEEASEFDEADDEYADDGADIEETDVAEQSYSSLLDVTRRVQPRRALISFDETPEAPALALDGTALLHAAIPMSYEAPASMDSSHAAPQDEAPQPMAGQAAVVAEETEQALRSALATLARMSRPE